MEKLPIPVLRRQRAYMNVLCDICYCNVQLKKCTECNTILICPYCTHHYKICNECWNINTMFYCELSNDDDRISHYNQLKHVNEQIKRLSSKKPPVLFGFKFPVLYNDMRVDRIVWQHKNLFGPIKI